MTILGGTKARLVVSLLMAGALAAGCGGGGEKAAAPPGSSPNVATSTPATAAGQPVDVSAVAARDLTSIDAQMKSLDTELGTADTGLSTQEGDPTK